MILKLPQKLLEVYNPVILKRFSEVWQAQEQLLLMNDFYTLLEEKLKTKFDFKSPILRKFFRLKNKIIGLLLQIKDLSSFLSLDLIINNTN
jgi:hypothetical protein